MIYFELAVIVGCCVVPVVAYRVMARWLDKQALIERINRVI